MPWQKVPLDASAGFYESASIVYRLDAGKLEQPLDVARVEGQKVVYEQVASSPLSDQSIGTLTITYPHPGGRTGWAQAKFALDSTPTKSTPATNWNPFRKKPKGPPPPTAITTVQAEVHEVWVLDIPSAESDTVFKLLTAQSFYNKDRPNAQDAQLTVTINGNQARKNWDQVVELNTLAQRVRREGRLASYARPGVLAGLPDNPITSIAAYNNLLARSGSSNAAAASLAASPFSMAPSSIGAGAVALAPGTVR